ncbi:type II toxin-antitoxin system RelE/ParE family toxin [uncultured Thiodictyon sp.]|uniref:type II toxin-antitoxin system RelE/ParE family toxin n=1 Tax=uncultured Thiodictyon sp. TaxID=1846217 RepID=UPI0025E8B539|nr:type II toxin-antitoxin system RelE/ParE family toxin [uncultured Thiodictyon sp.]
MRVRWTDQAFLRLAEIEDFIARDNPKAGARMAERIIDRGDALADQPYLGRPLPELPGTELREVIVGNYRIIYRVREDQVEVLTVFEGHRRLPTEDLPEGDLD